MRKDERLGLLPDPFIFRDGRRVTSIAEWEARRLEIKEDLVGLEFDGMPPMPEVFRVEPTHVRGKGWTSSYRIHCGRRDQPFTFCFYVYRPNVDGPCPVVLTGDLTYTPNCNDEVIAEANRRGFTVVKFNRTELAPDLPDPNREYGINALWPKLNFSAISAWAWGYHRVIDALMTFPFVDTEHIAITGHSRGGKTVLLAGATDERVRYTAPNGSGTHGGAPYRFIQREDEDSDYHDKNSEPLEFMLRAVGYWMGQGLHAYVGKEDTLPYDMHFLKALVAPRYYLETNGYADIWANPRGAYLAFLAAKEVWRLYGAEDKCFTSYREGGHRHSPYDFGVLFDLMEADIRKTPLPEGITRVPYDDMEPLHDFVAPNAN